MANKSGKSPSGENREQSEGNINSQKTNNTDKKDVIKKSGISSTHSSARGKQENLSNRGYEEDQPHHPVRNSGSTHEDQETLPTGEPDTNGK
ncbi:MAG: hypothetical protein ABI687_06805 [Flavitalea sp.]